MYCFDLLQGAVALCRTIIEDALVSKAKGLGIEACPAPGSKELSLANRIDSFKGFLAEHWVSVAHEIRKRGNNALHTPKIEVDETTVLLLLVNTAGLIEALDDLGRA